MNNDFYKGNEMNGGKMKMDGCVSGKCRQTTGWTKPWAALMGVMLACASAYVAAGQSDNPGKSGSNQWQCNDESKSRYQIIITPMSLRTLGIVSLESETILEKQADGSFLHQDRPGPKAYKIIIRFQGADKLNMAFTNLEGAVNLTYDCTRALSQKSSNSQNTALRDSTANNPNRTAGTPEADRLAQDLNAATTLAQNSQAKVDKARQGKPKRHVVGLEAHNCLKPQTGGGAVNSCPYAVEYNYCVLRPTKGTWSEAFDCEKGKGGSWQVGPGPNARTIMHTAGVTTYWFACKYGETLGKPDGVSPADIEFQAGRGLLGRCAQWGSSRN